MTLSLLLINRVSAFDSYPARKTNHCVTSAELEERLLLCICQCEQYKLIAVTGATIQAKVDKIRSVLVIPTLDKSAKLNALIISPGWHSKFQIPHRLTSKRVYGKEAYVSRAEVEKVRSALQDLTRGY
uniref:AlNc14C202G8714 protein n=1 Tax=Albugo laibachii Nc14 TaxID=890382 RepID=F0WQQ4_9STRA|nr:AlNc14C202G8714 [Albugo laibachii Nc14]|eukprot:CCA23663.1 AlNc14C202G8714 [Albugo laibachii Nc14]